MISKNEEKNIERCLKSLKGVADEVILVDTGSTDNTVSIAKSMGAKVYHDSWANDFSKARNSSLEHATGDWILFLDCDEELLSVDGEQVKYLINLDYSYEGYYLRLVNIIAGAEVSDAIVFRLFKNKKEYRFKGKMHEQVINSIQDIHGLDSVGATQIKIMHYGYDPAVSNTDAKSKRNLDILLAYEEKEKDGYYYYVLGNEYARISEYDEALRIYKKSLDVTDISRCRYIYYPYLVLNMIKSYYVKKEFQTELIELKKFQKNLPDFKDLYFMECLLHIDCSRFSMAKEALLKYKNVKSSSYEYPKNEFENYYNIAKIYCDLENGIVDHEENTLTVWISTEGQNPNLIDAVKCVNEISEDIIVVAKDSDNYDLSSAYESGASILKISTEDEDKAFEIAMRNSKGKYILWLTDNNLLSQDAQLRTMYLLKDEDEDGYKVEILSIKDESKEKSFRIFKNNNNIKSLEEYEDFIQKNNKDILDSKIIIHKKD